MAKQLLADIKAINEEFVKNIECIKRDLPVADAYVVNYKHNCIHDSMLIKIGQETFVQKGNFTLVTSFSYICGEWCPSSDFDIKDAIGIEIIAVMIGNHVELGFIHGKITFAIRSDVFDFWKILFFAKKLPTDLADRLSSILDRIGRNVIYKDRSLPYYDLNLAAKQYDQFILVDNKECYELVASQQYVDILRMNASKEKFKKGNIVGPARVMLVRDSLAISVGVKVGEKMARMKCLGTWSAFRQFVELRHLVSNGLEQEYVDR